jgi:hypothetical protein
MSGYRELLEPTRSGETEGEWVDFPASPEPDPWAALLRNANRLPPDASRGDYWSAKRAEGAMMTSVAVALRGLLVTTTAVATVAYLLLTNSHI